jgi:hypothetical protein
VKAGVVFGAVAAAIFIFINVATQGYWWIHIVLANINEFVPGQMEALYTQWYQLHIVLIWAAAAWVLYELSQRRLPLYAIWLIASVANGTLTGKWGAGESYFTTSVAALSLCAGLAFTQLHQLTKNRVQWIGALATVAIPLLFIVQAYRVLHLPTQGRLFSSIATLLNVPTDLPYYDSQGYTQLGRPPTQIDSDQGYKILAYVKDAPGPVMSEAAMFSLLAGKEAVSDSSQFRNLAKAGMFNSSNLIMMINQREFSLIILNAQFYPPDVLQAIGQAYRPITSLMMNNFNYTVLVPREN